MKRKLLILILILPIFASSQNNKNTEMTHTLKNKNLEIRIDLPLEKYNFSRFDWTGKIVSVKFKDIEISTVESFHAEDDSKIGKGFYNEFGIDAPIGFEETKEGEWFHKIGIGLLKKDAEPYLFSRKYEIQPAGFVVSSESNKITIDCISKSMNGYSYVLKKEIELLESSFIIRYHLKNTGQKTINTNEYDHNFMAINKELIGSDYILKFPFQIIPELFNATVNPENKVDIKQHEITFNGTPGEPFFFSNLSGNKMVDASWELINKKQKIGISETGSFKTTKVNLWGTKHVISPELFVDLIVQPGQKLEWSRTYHVFELK